MNGSLTWIIIPVPRAFAEGRVAAVHESRKWHECMDRLRFAREIVRGKRKSLICIRPV
jgi:hypothetical protein